MYPKGPALFIRPILVFFIFFTLFFTPPAASVLASTPAATGLPPSALETLKDLLLSMETLEVQILEKEKDYEKALIEERKQTIRSDLRHLLSLRDAYQREFESIATGVEKETGSHAPLKAFRLEEELMEVLRPLIESLKQMTSRPRELERLRRDIAFYQEALPEIRHALTRIQGFREKTQDPLLERHLTDLLRSWQEREKESQRQIRRLRFQLEQKTDPKEPMLVSMQRGLITFVKTRGRNLFLAFAAFVGTFLFLRFLYWKWSSSQKQSPPPLHHRLLQVLFHSTTAFASISMALLLLYAFGDWMLLSIALLLLIALAWSARNGMAQFWEQGKLILNMGTLREGERVIHMGIPWKVERLALHGILINPALEGGMLRIPLKNLVGMQSRPFAPEEPWFPSSTNDMLLLDEDHPARIVQQTPEQVIAELEGGGLRTWPAVTFMEQALPNLSRKGFGIQCVLRLDYAHHGESTAILPEKLKTFMEAVLAADPAGKHLKTLETAFMKATDSSLNIRVFAVFFPEAAREYLHLKRLLEKGCVDACSRFGWHIPFPQLTVHRR